MFAIPQESVYDLGSGIASDVFKFLSRALKSLLLPFPVLFAIKSLCNPVNSLKRRPGLFHLYQHVRIGQFVCLAWC
jgi:hypothetical protein